MKIRKYIVPSLMLLFAIAILIILFSISSDHKREFMLGQIAGSVASTFGSIAGIMLFETKKR